MSTGPAVAQVAAAVNNNNNNNSLVGTNTTTPSSTCTNVSSTSAQSVTADPQCCQQLPSPPGGASPAVLPNSSQNQHNNSTMASSVATAVLPAAGSIVTASSTNPAAALQKEPSTESVTDSLSRQSSLGGRQRTLGGKGKHLTRSHAMRESTSPPRTPTPRSPAASDQQHNNAEPGLISSSSPPSNSNNNSPGSPAEARLFNSSSNNNNNNNEYGEDHRGGKSQLDVDFPKLTPPKSSFGQTNGGGGGVKNGSNGRSVKGDCEKTGAKNGSSELVMSEAKQPEAPPGLTVSVVHGQNNTMTGSGATTGTSSTTTTIMNTSSSSPVSSNNNYCDNENRNLREVNFSANNNDSNNQINIQFSHEENRYIQCESPTDSLIRNNSSSNNNLNSSTHTNKKHRANGSGGGGGGGGGPGERGGGGNPTAGGKGNKPRLKHMSGGSSSSVDGGGGSLGGGGGGGGGSTSYLSRDNSCDQFTDQSGVNLIQFFKETLNKNFKDRNMLMKIEKELLALAMDRSRSQIKFPPMSSYNRMLIHRVAAYFGMEHNVDATQQSVIAEVTSATRIPEIRFKTLINESFSEEPRKSILKRDTHSFDEYRYGLLHCPDQRGVLDRKAKSFEEREEEYEKSKRRIFKHRDDGGSEEQWQWLSADHAEPMNGRPKLQNNRLLKVQSVSIEGRSDERPCVSKSHSFGGYGGSAQNAPLLRGDSITSTKSASARLFTKQDSNASTNTPWRLSPSSSGYKTQSIRSDSVTPSPTGYGSGDHTPEPCIQSPSATCGVVWAVTDMASVPKGSVLIDPQTLQPIVNQDGSIYHFDPSNLPSTTNLPGTTISRVQKKKFEKQKSFSNRNASLNSSSSLESSIDLPLGGGKNDCGQQTNNPSTTTTTTIAEEIGNEYCYDTGGSTTTTVKICTKDSHDSVDESSSLCEELSQTTNELSTLKLQKHQATSPMLQASELQPLELNEIQLNDDHGSLAVTPVINDAESGQALMMAVVPVNDSKLLPEDEGANEGEGSDTSSQATDKKDDALSHHHHQNQQHHHAKMNNSVVHQHQHQTQAVPLVSYSNSATPNSGCYTINYENGTPGSTTVYATAAGAPGMSTTYQTAPDGTIYAVPSPLVYTYPTAMDPEMSGYFVPVYDQQRDPNMAGATLYPTASAHGATAGGASTVLPIAYAPTAAAAAAAAAYGGAPLYQNHPAGTLMYSPADQFSAAGASQAAAAAAAAAAPLQQYPIGYPIGIGYPFNNAAYQNYWNQPITYYVPQTPVPSAGSTPLLMPPPVSQTPTNGAGMMATSAPTPISNAGKRNTTPPGHHGGHNNSHHHHHQPQQQHQHQHPQSQSQSASVTPVPISPFTTNIPMQLPDPNGGGGGPVYAIPQPIYSNMLPFAATGPMTPHHHPHHHPGHGHPASANSVLPTATTTTSTGYHPQGGNSDSLPSSNGSASNSYSNQPQQQQPPTSATPQSTPSTPLPLAMPPHGAAAKNPPLFATPPILPNGYAPQMGGSAGSGAAGHHHYGGHNSYEDRKGSGGSSSGGGGYQGKRSNSGNYFSYGNSNNNSRQMTPNGGYQGGPKNPSYAGGNNSNNNNNNNTGNNQNTNGPLMLGQPPNKPRAADGQTGVSKPPLIPTLPNSTPNSSGNGAGNGTNTDKSRINRSSKPPNLDLKRNFNNYNVNSRNTPSTNSTESNNSPNSITSSSVHEQHQPHHHHVSQHHSTHGGHHTYSYPQGGGGGGGPGQSQPPYYSHHHGQRGGSVGSNNGGGGGGGGNGSGNQTAASIQSAAAAAAITAAACAATIDPYHHAAAAAAASQLIPLNAAAAAGMSYVKIGQTYYTHPSLALPPSRRSPPNDIRPIAGVYPTVNMVMPTSRQFTPRPQHSGSFNKGSKAPR